MAEAPAVYLDQASPPAVQVPGDNVPVRQIDVRGLRQLGMNLENLFKAYRSDRRIQELRWLRNLRQYLGFYDPEIEKYMSPERSRAYPKITRTKCISMLARIMDLMFPSDDRNWTIEARPSADMDIKDVMLAIQAAQMRDAANAPPGPDGQPAPAPPLTSDYVNAAVMELAQQRAAMLTKEIDDQLQELGGDQSYDYIALNKETVASGIVYGIGVLTGPYAREVSSASWEFDAQKQMPVAKKIKKYMPQFEFLRCWDYYPDMSAKRLDDGDGYFTRKVMSKRQVRELADREDFFPDVIKAYLTGIGNGQGNYRAQEFETELRSMGVKANVNEQKQESSKYEIIVWHGPVDGSFLQMAGVEVAADKVTDQIDAEVWLLDGHVIKADMNPWVALGRHVKTAHAFIFDQDDTAPIGFGLPNIMRDTQMSISAATRMMMDNASVVCGPILEINTALLRADQDTGPIHAYKQYYRDDEGATAQWPAVRAVQVGAHIDELEKIIELFLRFGDMETAVGAATGGDMKAMPSEPMRNAAGASMMLGQVALPFKDIIRNFDRFTQSMIQSLVSFNRLLNPTKAQTSEYDVIARGATSLIAKELRGAAVDMLATSLAPEDLIYVDRRKLVEARFKARDLEGMMVSETEAARRQASQDTQSQQMQDVQTRTAEAAIRKTLADAFKNIAQGQKNQALASADAVNTALDVLERGEQSGLTHASTMNTHADTLSKLAQATQGPNDGQQAGAGAGADPSQGANPPGGDGPGDGSGQGAGLLAGGPGGAGAGLGIPAGLPLGPGQGAGLQ